MSEKHSRSHGCFKVIIDGVYGVFIIYKIMSTLTLKTKKIRVFGADKRRKTLAGHKLGHNLLKEEIWVGILSGQDNIFMEDG